MGLNRKLHIPLYIQLKDRILSEIRSEKYEVGDKISTEHEWMSMYQVGRQTVREALNQLVKEGYLEKRQGVGTFIARKDTSVGFEPLISLSYSLSIRGISHHNGILENTLIKNEEQPKTDQMLSDMRKILSDEVMLLKRLRFVDDMPIAIETFYFDSSFKEMIGSFDLSGSLGKFLLEDLKLQIARMSQEVTICSASEEEAKLLGIDPGDSLMFMQRWLYTQKNKGVFQYLELKVPVGVSTFPKELL